MSEIIKVTKTKVLGVDVYGTFLCSYDPDYELPVRRGFTDLTTRLREKGIRIVTTSDAGLSVLCCDLEEYKIPRDIFSSMHKMIPSIPKNYSCILEQYGIAADELFVIGDLQGIDIDPAIQLGCNACLVPGYTSWDDSFDMMSLIDRIL